jgi:hypothetical protein
MFQVLATAMAIFTVVLLMVPVSSYSANIGGNVGFGETDCSSVKRKLTSQWSDLRQFFRPQQKDLKRPRSREFFCVSPQYTRDSLPTRRFSASLKCYDVQGTRFCCDANLSACAGMK